MPEIRMTRSDGTELTPSEQRQFLKETGLWVLPYTTGSEKFSRENLRQMSQVEAAAKLAEMGKRWSAIGRAWAEIGRTWAQLDLERSGEPDV